MQLESSKKFKASTKGNKRTETAIMKNEIIINEIHFPPIARQRKKMNVIYKNKKEGGRERKQR